MFATPFPVRFEPTYDQIRADFLARQQARANRWDYTEFSRDSITWETWIQERGSLTQKHVDGGWIPMVPSNYFWSGASGKDSEGAA